jgi:hypothetical protein
MSVDILGISLSKVSRGYDGKLTHAVLLALFLVASCLLGGLPKVTPVNFLYWDKMTLAAYLRWTCEQFAWYEPWC